jgi:glycerophosphoryl diester phosphodiesterase
MSLLLGHRGLSSKHLENSLEAFRAALAVGMDGFELDVQPSRDGVCMVLHDETLDRTTTGTGALRQLSVSGLPPLRNGEALPRLVDALELPARLINVELKGEPGWKQALAAVEAAEAVDRVLFSSFEHSEVLQLWAECPEARCGFLWEGGEAMDLTADELADLPPSLWLHVPLRALKDRPQFWAPHADRIAAWGMKSASEVKALPFEPAVVIADGI